ncbi:RNA-directed DNA polymerase, eukaryota, reverse transcriptase zinc-binding domain protein [Tanacetum coccineum]
MESGNQGGGYPNFGKSQKHPLVPPPMTAIGRFLQGQSSQSHSSHHNFEINKEQFIPSNGVYGFSSSSNEGISGMYNKKLLRLVKLHGERKWAHIAEQMIGRAGKQCRERWHNHLRPDIKLESIDPSKQIAIIEHYLYILGHLESIDPSTCISWKLSSSALEMLVPGHAIGNVMGRGRANVDNICIESGRVGKLSHSPWNSVIHMVYHLQAKDIELLALCGRSLGDGNSISYWGDKWCGTRPLKDSFPRVYALDDNKLCMVAQCINIEDWSFVLRRPPRGGAKSYQLDELIQFTQDVVLSDSTDAWTWELDKSGYSVSSALNVFIWRLRLDELSTLVNMDRKGIDVDSLLCPICKTHVENVDHLFFSCEMAHDLWDLLARWCNLDIPEVSNITEWFSWLDDAYVSKSARVILEGIASTMLWFIWNFHNACIFLSSKPKKANVWDSIVHYLFLWISSRNPKSRFRWIDWLGKPIDTLTPM